MTKKLRVLVIDDSSYNRRTLSEILNSDPGLEVIETAPDGEKGLKAVHEVQPDLITVDIEMPRMDGFTFLRLLMSQRPTPVIVVSSHNRKQEVFQALELGALDFVAKPTRFFSAEGDQLREELIRKAKAVRSLQIMHLEERTRRRPVTGPIPVKPELPEARPEDLKCVVCVGASTGGPPALQTLFKAMGHTPNTAFLVAQHMPEKFTRAFAERLDRSAGLTIREATNGEPILPGYGYVAPGGYHLEAVESGGKLTIRVEAPTAADHYVPSIDRLFASVAHNFQGTKIVAVLTGMGTDGSLGVGEIRAAGGTTLAESDETAIVFGMPKSAIDTGVVDQILPLDKIISSLHTLARQD